MPNPQRPAQVSVYQAVTPYLSQSGQREHKIPLNPFWFEDSTAAEQFTIERGTPRIFLDLIEEQVLILADGRIAYSGNSYDSILQPKFTILADTPPEISAQLFKAYDEHTEDARLIILSVVQTVVSASPEEVKDLIASYLEHAGLFPHCWKSLDPLPDSLPDKLRQSMRDFLISAARAMAAHGKEMGVHQPESYLQVEKNLPPNDAEIREAATRSWQYFEDERKRRNIMVEKDILLGSPRWFISINYDDLIIVAHATP